MARADLNVRLGVITRNFEKSLDRASRKLRRTAQSMESVGTSLTQAVSLPIVGVGIGALKSAAEFEQFEKALIAVTGSTEEAQRQLTRLQKIAEAPGIGFNQAVAASLQLQGLGVDAGRAEEAITQVANAVAASGGGAQAFEGVVRQLNQIQAKNRVLQEDINILLENAPVLGEQLQEAFGGKTAEAIRDAGVNGEQFFDILVKQLASLERVEGGLANTFENFGISVRKALADVGQEIDRVVGVQSIVDRLTKSINDAVRVFKDLDDETKRSILRLVAFAAAAGPVVFVGSRILSIYKGVFDVFASVAKGAATLVARIQVLTAATATNATATKAASASTKGLASAFRALSLAQKATIIGLAVAAIGLVVAKFVQYKNAIDQVTNAQRSFEFINRKAAQQADQEVSKVDAVIKKINQGNISREERLGLIKQLQKDYPKYFGNLDAEKVKVDDLRSARNKLRDSILQTARARAAEAKLQEVETELLEVREKQFEAFQRLNDAQASGARTSRSLKDGATIVSVAYREAEAEIARYAKQIESLTEIQQRLADIGTQNVTANVETTTTDTTPTGPAGEVQLLEQAYADALKASIQFRGVLRGINEDINAELQDAISSDDEQFKPISTSSSIAIKALSDLREEYKKIDTAAAVLGENTSFQDQQSIIAQKIRITRDALVEAAQKFGLNSLAVQTLREELSRLQGQLSEREDPLNLVNAFGLPREIVENVVAGFDNVKKGIDTVVAQSEQVLAAVALVRETITAPFEDFFTTLVEGGKNAFGQFAKTLGQTVKKIIADLLSAIAVAAVLALILGPILGGGTFASQFGTLLKGGGGIGSIFAGIVGLAQGGIVPSGYPNDTYLARLSSGEAVIPLNRLNSMLDMGGGQMVADTVIRGEDIVLSYNRASKTLGR